jgi:hypothetical protein
MPIEMLGIIHCSGQHLFKNSSLVTSLDLSESTRRSQQNRFISLLQWKIPPKPFYSLPISLNSRDSLTVCRLQSYEVSSIKSQ